LIKQETEAVFFWLLLTYRTPHETTREFLIEGYCKNF